MPGGNLTTTHHKHKNHQDQDEPHHELLGHEAALVLHHGEHEVGHVPPVLLLALAHQAQRAVVHLYDHLQGVMITMEIILLIILLLLMMMEKVIVL